MTASMTPEHRLAASRARLASALREPAWLILLQRWAQARATPQANVPPSAARNKPTVADGDRAACEGARADPQGA
jgi:hypothetical protein